MKQKLFDMSDDVFQIGYHAGYQAAREGEIVVPTPASGAPGTASNYHLLFANGASLGFARGCQDREANERRVREQLGTDYRKER